MLAIADSGANIHLSRQATPTMAPVIMYNEMKSRLPDGSTMESAHIETLQLPGLSKLARQIHILPKMQTVEEHRSLGDSIISRLDNGAFVGLIYKLLVFS